MIHHVCPRWYRLQDSCPCVVPFNSYYNLFNPHFTDEKTEASSRSIDYFHHHITFERQSHLLHLFLFLLLRTINPQFVHVKRKPSISLLCDFFISLQGHSKRFGERVFLHKEMILPFSLSLSVTWADADLIVCSTKSGSEAWQSVCPLWAYSEE